MRLDVANYLHRVKGSIRIPKGTPSSKCRGARCSERIYFVGKQPVSIHPWSSVAEGIAPTAEEDGAGISHFANCIDAPKFGARKR